ncbi:hypothetical protein [Yinghuangia seranimata]|uniref:hypothetical protein n=1 Tax=Yinghuangia seranimata TaxID=408067 RepID=UPI00248D1545|nr:hypothetical protein [Yinghuangia seranimata]MDI2129129.1 hypothetical protein [Yinghuangia seranimata]
MGTRVEWGTEACCRTCGEAWAECGRGAHSTPEDIRQALLSEHGPTRLRLAAPAPVNRTAVLRALRQAYSRTLTETRALADALAGTGMTGTLVEMERTAAFLRHGGVAVTLTQVRTEALDR